MKIYTRTGDDGSTGLFGGGRVSKSETRVEAYGDIDELGSVLGLAGTELASAATRALLVDVQSRLFDLGAELASTPGKDVDLGAVPRIDAASVAQLERAIDEAEQPLPPLTSFVIAGGCVGARWLHLARTVCRRAERHVVRLSESESVSAEAIRYLNRLSDLLFVLARAENQLAGEADLAWLGRKSG